MSEERRASFDRLLGGRLGIRQSTTGHRAGTDAMLLAAAADGADASRFVDVGAGVGTAGLVLAARDPAACGALLERDRASAEDARVNCRDNGLSDRLVTVEADLFDTAARQLAGLDPERATLVITNPPFHRAGDVRASPDRGRAGAHVLDGRDHGDWLRAAAALLAPKGHFVMINRPEALPMLLAAAAGRIGALVVRPVQARAGDNATRILVGGIKGSRTPLRIAPGLVLHGPDGRFTPEIEAVHRGEAGIAM